MSTNKLALAAYLDVGKPQGMSSGEIIGHNLKRLRKRAGMSVNHLAKEVGVRLNTIQAIEKGETQKSKYLPDIARVLQVSLGELDPTQKLNNVAPSGVRDTGLPKKEQIGPRDLDVYGTTEAGEGVMVMSSEPVDKADRPPSLTHVTDAYGVIVTGNSMIPVIRPGDVAVVHPHKHPRRDDLCIFRCHSHGEFRSTIKELVAETKDGWRVRRYHPQEKELILKRQDWPECHVVVTVHRR